MYSVYLTDYNATPNQVTPTVSGDELYIYNPIVSDEEYTIIEPTLSLKSSQAGTFSATLPYVNYGYARIIKGLTRAVVKRNDKIIFMGRINSEERDLYLNQKFTAEGALSYLNDSLTDKRTLVDKTLAELLIYIFNNHNAKFPNEPWKHFHLEEENCLAKFVGYDVKDEESELMSTYAINFDKSLDLVTELLDLAKAIIKIEYNDEEGYWDVYIYDKFNLPITSKQPIEFGSNLIDLIQSYDRTDICTAIAPFGGELIQTPTEIGEAVAGEGIDENAQDESKRIPGAHWYPDYIYVRGTDDKNYHLEDIRGSTWANSGYWSFKLDISAYNNANPDNKLKKIFVSWRGYKYVFNEFGPEYICDCAWRVYDSVGVILGFNEFKDNIDVFDSDINTEIDLTSPQYLDASVIYVTGWGNLITPLIRRDAEIAEQEELLSIKNCEFFGPDENGISHLSEYPYFLRSENLISLYGLIEKRIDYNVEDTNNPVSDWDPNYDGPLGHSTKFLDSILAYDAGDGSDLDTNKGNYQIIDYPPAGSGYSCIQYDLPPLNDPNRPRGLFLSSRLDYYWAWNIIDYQGRHWKADGLYAVYDTSWQVLAYETCASTGTDWKNIKDFFLDLSDPKYYGAAHVRICGYGGVIPVSAIPSDNSFSQNRLLAQAKLYLTDYQWEKVVIEATAVDLNITGEEWDSFDVSINAPVISEMHGIASTLQITALDIQLDSPENNTIKLGYDNDEYLSSQLA